MLSESARMSSAAEARFRVQAPNSMPRVTRVVGLDAAGERVVRRLAAAGLTHATFLTAVILFLPQSVPEVPTFARKYILQFFSLRSAMPH